MSSRHRLRGRRRFAAVRSVGLRGASGGIRAHLAANDREVARVGYALVGIRDAVTRNRLRRRLREASRPLLEGLAGRDLVVVAGADAAAMSFDELKGALTGLIERLLARARSADGPLTADNGPMSGEPADGR